MTLRRVGLVGGAVCALAIAGVLLWTLVSHRHRDHARDYFTQQATQLCDVVGSPGDVGYRQCVDDLIADDLAEWEHEGRPDPATVHQTLP